MSLRDFFAERELALLKAIKGTILAEKSGKSGEGLVEALFADVAGRRFVRAPTETSSDGLPPIDRLQQLKDRDALLTMAEESAGIGIWNIDLPTETVRGTPQFWRIYGLPPTDEALPIEVTRIIRDGVPHPTGGWKNPLAIRPGAARTRCRRAAHPELFNYIGAVCRVVRARRVKL